MGWVWGIFEFWYTKVQNRCTFAAGWGGSARRRLEILRFSVAQSGFGEARIEFLTTLSLFLLWANTLCMPENLKISACGGLMHPNILAAKTTSASF